MKIKLPLQIQTDVIITFLCSILIFLYLEINFWKCFGLWDTLQVDIFRLMLAIGCFGIAFIDGWKIRIPIKCINYLIIIIGVGLLIQFVNGRNPIGMTISAIITVLLAFVFATRKIYLSFLYIHILILSLIIGYKFYSGEDPNMMFVGTSRNTISVFFMIAAIMINMEELKNKKSISIWPALLFLVYSIAAVGRGGVICALFYLVSVFGYKLYTLDRKTRRRVIGLLLSTGILICIFYASMVFDYILSLDVFMRLSGEKASGDGRELMNLAYLENINFLTFFYGYDFSANPVFLAEGNLNPHNSFITLHSRYGFWGIIFLGILIDTMLKLRGKNKIIYVFILLTVLLRGSSEQIMFPGEYDFIILTIILLTRLKPQYDIEMYK